MSDWTMMMFKFGKEPRKSRVPRSLSWSLSLVLGVGVLPPASVLLCSAPVYAGEFGTDGGDGTSGSSGQSGRSGRNQTVTADGTPKQLDLAGQDGSDGGDGTNGENALCGIQPFQKEENLNAADGGDGGNGGSGGNGGNGGMLTVYYQNLADLQKILVNAEGGEGGEGGRGGYGGRACGCTDSSWSIEVCKTGKGRDIKPKCDRKRYTCTDGTPGRRGTSGADGVPGQRGSLRLIAQREPIAEEQPVVTQSIAQLSGKTVNLSRNRWEARNGALALLAPGSKIADRYEQFIEQLTRSVKFVWNDPQQANGFSDVDVTLTLMNDRTVDVGFPDDLWVGGNLTEESGQVVYTVAQAIRKKDVTRLAVSDFVQSGSSVKLNLVDLAGKSNLVTTEFRLKLQVKDSDRPFGSTEKLFDGKIPPEAIRREHNQFTLNLDQLKLQGDLNTRDAIDLELTATRSYAGRSTQQKINWQGNLRRG